MLTIDSLSTCGYGLIVCTDDELLISFIFVVFIVLLLNADDDRLVGDGDSTVDGCLFGLIELDMTIITLYTSSTVLYLFTLRVGLKHEVHI